MRKRTRDLAMVGVSVLGLVASRHLGEPGEEAVAEPFLELALGRPDDRVEAAVGCQDPLGDAGVEVGMEVRAPGEPKVWRAMTIPGTPADSTAALESVVRTASKAAFAITPWTARDFARADLHLVFSLRDPRPAVVAYTEWLQERGREIRDRLLG